MKILVTGAAGLIGRHLIASFEDGHEVWAVSRSPLADAGRVHGVRADLTSAQFVEALPPSIDAVVHLAQSPAYRDFPGSAPAVFAVNVASTATLLDWARRAGASRFILASAGGAGSPSSSPLAYYLATKRSAELLALSYHAQFAVTALRLHFVYGKGQRATWLMPRLIESVKNGAAITLAGPEGIRITPTHVSDATAAIRCALGLDGSHVIDVGGPEVLSIKAIGSIIGAKLGREPRFDIRPDDVAVDVIADTAAMRTLLAPPQRRFDAGIDDLLA